MIQNPFLLLAALTALVAIVQFAFSVERLKRFFRFLPVPLWCYFLPTLLGAFGILPKESQLYAKMTQLLLPACLFLLLLGTDIPSLLRMSRSAALAMAAGSAGILLGVFITFALMIAFVDPANVPAFAEVWKGWGCLAATWTGGSANMISVKEILQTPEAVFSNLIVVDTIVAYSWMALLVFLSKYQDAIDGKLGALWNADVERGAPLPGEEGNGMRTGNVRTTIGLALLGLAAGFLCWQAAAFLPQWGTVLNRMTWTVILASMAPLLLSLTPARKLEAMGASRTGTLMLFLLLTSFGARADLRALFSTPLFLVMGILIVLIHGVILAVAGRLFRIPSALLAAASQANVGGPVSAPIVATVYRDELAPLAVVLAVLGNILGTYIGLFASQVCKWLSLFVK